MCTSTVYVWILLSLGQYGNSPTVAIAQFDTLVACESQKKWLVANSRVDYACINGKPV